MRVILFVGKGGVGKTSMAAATALRAARLGYRTLILSLDIAHNLSDIFDLDRSLFDTASGKPVKVADNLWIQELDMHRELQRNWREVHSYLSLLLNTTGLDHVLAEELAILPGMEEVSALLWINAYVKNKTFDALILDCAPTGESIRFISIPTALEWYIKKIFKLERNIARVVRPIARHVSDIPMPEEAYFDNIERLFVKLQGSAEILTDPMVTSVRLVANPEKIVLKETLRAFMYFYLYKVNVDAVILNRLIPASIIDGYFLSWKESHARYTLRAREYFDPIPIFTADLLSDEVVGIKSLETLGDLVYGGRNPLTVFYCGSPFEFSKEGDYTVVRINMPFADKKDIEVYRVGDELVVKLGACRRNIPLPRSSLGTGGEVKARFRDGRLEVLIGGREDGGRSKE
ncbi:MAG: TRC40/GET3/ArsA family transport-energizing ATPase [Syntrophobacterales bacterium]|nr:TRC40/GET3/ArsA family transport-energizing ATPase [Syntrophobacterales bacterium]